MKGSGLFYAQNKLALKQFSNPCFFMITPKPLFAERMRTLLPEEKDFTSFMNIIHEYPRNYIRCNTLKISPSALKARLEEKNWKIKQVFSSHPEIMLIESALEPGALGKALEHLLGYYYVQEVSSMMPALALEPKPDDLVLDLCAAPGSKTTQISALMQNKGTIVANDKTIDRMVSLVSNLERCGCTNAIVTREDAIAFCRRLEKTGFRFDKILLDVPCSGEGNLRSSPRTFTSWSMAAITELSSLQKKIAFAAVPLLKESGTLVYSTCTHSPEENEAIVSSLAETFSLSIEKTLLPLKCRSGISTWQKQAFNSGIENSCRIYPQDNDSEGFFVAKLKKVHS